MDEKEQLLETMGEGVAAFVRALSGCTEDLARLRPSPGKWSILECVEHVVIAEEYMRNQMLKATQAEEPAHNVRREQAILERGADRSRRVQAPDVAIPAGRFQSLEAAIQHFLSQREQTIRYVKECDRNLRAMITSHPVLGTVNCHETLLLIAVHPHRHAKQIGELRAAHQEK